MYLPTCMSVHRAAVCPCVLLGKIVVERGANTVMVPTSNSDHNRKRKKVSCTEGTSKNNEQISVMVKNFIEIDLVTLHLFVFFFLTMVLFGWLSHGWLFLRL